MALVGVELEMLVSEPYALTFRPPPCASINLVFLRKTLYANIPTSGGTAHRIRALVGYRKVVNSRFGFRTAQCVVLSLGKTLQRIFPQRGQAIYPSWWPSLTKD